MQSQARLVILEPPWLNFVDDLGLHSISPSKLRGGRLSASTFIKTNYSRAERGAESPGGYL